MKEASPKSTGRVVAAIAAIVVALAAIGVAAYLAFDTPASDEASTGDSDRPLIGIEVRAKPPARVRIDGHAAGRTPLTVHVRWSHTPVQIQAESDGRVRTKSVVPDHDQLVDFPPGGP